ncbi:MAG: HD domain-containing protein [Bacilli bacterium]|nr:HD domain-containing protein [Bacilli bacterium]
MEMLTSMDKKVEKNMSKKNLSKYACSDDNAYRITQEKEDIRPPFFRDIDRIIYSHSYLRYENKTQVFSYIDNDHVTNRMLHVQLVSKAARTIGRALRLNEDLIEAAALAHDLGHVPIGHLGESILNKISIKNNNGYFNHNIHSVRTLMYIENNGKGINLNVQTLDAIMCHNGEMVLGEYYPKNKSLEEFLEEYNSSYKIKDICSTFRPMTLEGCVVRLCDVVAYIGRDIEDAILLGVIKKDDIPKSIVDVLGSTNQEIVNTLILDAINNSLDKPYIKLSKEVFDAIVALKRFNYEHIYMKANDENSIKKYELMFEKLFEKYLSDIRNDNKKSVIYTDYLNDMDASYIENNTDVAIVIDFIAGMTDEYFYKQYQRSI